ncbi:hypothetical protein HMPREF9554_00518 [Treponema phagedenis F0421]|nr:hypothetical protein HMPREF9554_00518 [Treponema phagedenis F0421]
MIYNHIITRMRKSNRKDKNERGFLFRDACYFYYFYSEML